MQTADAARAKATQQLMGGIGQTMGEILSFVGYQGVSTHVKIF
jgi:hypothetical protein